MAETAKRAKWAALSMLAMEYRSSGNGICLPSFPLFYLYYDSVWNANHNISMTWDRPHFLAEFVGAGRLQDRGFTIMDFNNGGSEGSTCFDNAVLVQGIKTQCFASCRNPYTIRPNVKGMENIKAQPGKKDQDDKDGPVPPGDSLSKASFMPF